MAKQLWPCGFPGGGGIMGASAHAIVCRSAVCRRKENGVPTKKQKKHKPCPHPGKYHKSKDGLTIIKPHPQADSCFAREQGYVVCRIEAAYKDQIDTILAALNGEET